MNKPFFIDTNILLYAGSKASADQANRQIARQLLSQPGRVLSAQVLQEFYDVAVRKQRLAITSEEAIAILTALRAFPILPIDYELVLQAIDLKMRFQISYWDAAIVAAAQRLGCHTLYTEDLNHGQNYNGVTVINPFL